MKSLEKITERIERLRERLTDLIQLKEDLIDPEVVRVSKLLDKELNEYNDVVFDRFCSEIQARPRKIG